ncbi:MAG: fibronectin type III domain-containing protein [Flavobacteriales bacterium]|nr:fibronectin type III domain-containing protein [Flavobacteriales bacterium]
MKKILYTVKLGFTKLTAAALVGKGRTNVEMMTGNVTYATPIPPLATITAACDTLDAASNAYDFSRSRLDKEDRDVAFAELKGLLKELGGYVQAISKGDKDLILSAGFEVEKAASPIGQLPAPPNVRALVTPYPERLEVKWGGVKGRTTYELWMTDGDPKVEANWKLHAITSKNRAMVEGLTSNTIYFFRVVAQGAAGASPVSDTANAKAA